MDCHAVTGGEQISRRRHIAAAIPAKAVGVSNLASGEAPEFGKRI